MKINLLKVFRIIIYLVQVVDNPTRKILDLVLSNIEHCVRQDWVQVHVLVFGLRYRFSQTCTWSLKIQWYLYLNPKYLKKYKVHSSTNKYIVFNKKKIYSIINYSEPCDDTIG